LCFVFAHGCNLRIDESFDFRRHAFNGRLLKQAEEREFYTETLLYFGDQLGAQERMSAEIEKVVVHADPLQLQHVKPRLLGHWGTTPGLNFLYAHLNRVIRKYDLDMIYVTGPGHGGPALVANAYLEGTYSEVYPNISADEAGMKRLFTQFSFPGGIPSHVAPETPGSIHEGGELGYALSHAYGAAFDNPDLIVACVVGDGEAETGPMATSWHSNKFLNAATDGAVRSASSSSKRGDAAGPSRLSSLSSRS